MSVIMTNMDMPRCCGSCKMSATDVCTKWFGLKRYELGEKRSVECPLRSVRELFAKLSELPTVELSDGQDYVQMYDVLQCIKDYCGIWGVMNDLR